MTRDLRDMVVVITGASAGIGRTLAQQLAARGAKLVLAARRAEKLEALNRELGGDHLTLRADVASTADCEMIISRAMERFGRIDTLVCNAGYGAYRHVSETSPQQIREMFATNVFGTTDTIHAAIPHLLRQSVRDGWRGQVMIVSSAAARRGVPYLGPYAATKAAQLSIAEALRVEMRRHHIAVTSVHPIMTPTEFGQVAEAGGVKLPRSRGMTQTVDHVARTMVRAIQRPRPEVWPHAPTRFALAVASLLPRVTDRLMARFMADVQVVNERKSTGASNAT
jgi:short-subunit dehydrogenase